jgi:hypothetical protein
MLTLVLVLPMTPLCSLLQQSLSESDEHLAHFDRGGCERSMFALRTKLTVDRPLKVGLELIRFPDRHRHIAREISVGRTTASFCDVRRYRVRRASDLIRKAAPLACKKPSERGGFEGKHVGFLPYQEFSEIRHGPNPPASRRKSVTIPRHSEAKGGRSSLLPGA